jgi:hypothetical protein
MDHDTEMVTHFCWGCASLTLMQPANLASESTLRAGEDNVGFKTLLPKKPGFGASAWNEKRVT